MCAKKHSEEKRTPSKEGYIEAVWERFGSTTCSSAAFKKKARSATSKRTVHLGHPRRQPGDIKPQRETCCSKIRISSHSAKIGLNLCVWLTSSCRKSNRLKCMCSPPRYCVWDRTRCPTLQLLATTKHDVSLTCDAVGKECTPETYLHRIVFVGLINELAVVDKPR